MNFRLPAFFPDATYASINSLPFHDISLELKGIVITTLHSYLHKIDTISENMGGFKNFAKLNNIITLSDSGGFQVYSLIERTGRGEVTNTGATFMEPKSGSRITLTPELSQQIQKRLNTDIRVALDFFSDDPDKLEKQANSVRITTEWAKRSKQEFLIQEQLSEDDFSSHPISVEGNIVSSQRPLLVGVNQGGNIEELRVESARELKQIGFDIYGFGGWPLDKNSHLNTRIIEAYADQFSNSDILYGMGIGTPDDIAKCYKIGLKLFDCVLPTRNARHGLIYVTKGKGEPSGELFDTLHIKHSRYQLDKLPLDPSCDCPVCKNYNRAYIRLLQKNKNTVGSMLATLHNVWWYLRFMENLPK